MTGELADHEAFLRAIFDAPADDTPRLVYADFLEEHGAPDRAELIRVQCELESGRDVEPGRAAWLRGREHELVMRVVPIQTDGPVRSVSRGFWEETGGVELSADDLADAHALRRRIINTAPSWYAQKRLSIRPPNRLGPEHVEALFTLPFVQQVTDWDLGGHVEDVPADPSTEEGGTFALIDMNVSPVITLEGVEALANHRGARRIRTLILTHNNLGNDAARALARSKYLINLEHLVYREGNNTRGRVWQELVERYGENVVG